MGMEGSGWGTDGQVSMRESRERIEKIKQLGQDHHRDMTCHVVAGAVGVMVRSLSSMQEFGVRIPAVPCIYLWIKASAK